MSTDSSDNLDEITSEIGEFAFLTYSELAEGRSCRPLEFPAPVSTKTYLYLTKIIEHQSLIFICYITSLFFDANAQQ